MPTTTEDKTVEVTLDNDHSINGVKYPAGTHKVSEELAKDLASFDKIHNQYLLGLNKNNPVSGNLGSVSAA